MVKALWMKTETHQFFHLQALKKDSTKHQIS